MFFRYKKFESWKRVMFAKVFPSKVRSVTLVENYMTDLYLMDMFAKMQLLIQTEAVGIKLMLIAPAMMDSFGHELLMKVIF